MRVELEHLLQQQVQVAVMRPVWSLIVIYLLQALAQQLVQQRQVALQVGPQMIQQFHPSYHSLVVPQLLLQCCDYCQDHHNLR